MQKQIEYNLYKYKVIHMPELQISSIASPLSFAESSDDKTLQAPE